MCFAFVNKKAAFGMPKTMYPYFPIRFKKQNIS